MASEWLRTKAVRSWREVEYVARWRNMNDGGKRRITIKLPDSMQLFAQVEAQQQGAWSWRVEQGGWNGTRGGFRASGMCSTEGGARAAVKRAVAPVLTGLHKHYREHARRQLDAKRSEWLDGDPELTTEQAEA